MVPIIGTVIRMFQNKEKKEQGVVVRMELEGNEAGLKGPGSLMPEPRWHSGGLTGRSVGTWALFPSGYTMFF